MTPEALAPFQAAIAEAAELNGTGARRPTD